MAAVDRPALLAASHLTSWPWRQGVGTPPSTPACRLDVDPSRSAATPEASSDPRQLPEPGRGARGPFGRILVVSPHLDDGVFSCGDLLAAHPGSTVVTVFAGGPTASPTLARWDEAAEFAPGDDVIAARRREDAAALRILDARPMWLSFWDSQYEGAPRVEDIRHAVEQAIMAAEPDTVCLPLGLWHSDHRLTHEATQPLDTRHPGFAWLACADAIYRRFPDAGLLDRLDAMERASLAPVALPSPSREAPR